MTPDTREIERIAEKWFPLEPYRTNALRAITEFASQHESGENNQDTELLREARLALKAAMIPLAVLVTGEARMPYKEHGMDLKRAIQEGHDAICQTLMKITDAHKAWLEKL